MWPDDYIDWARRARPEVSRLVSQALKVLLAGAAPRLRADIPGLTHRIMREAFDLANTRRSYPEYFQDEAEFQRWLTAVALRLAMRLFLEHSPVSRALNLLPPGQRRVLGLVYLDQLNFSDVATVLQTTAQEVSRRKIEALDALRQLL